MLPHSIPAGALVRRPQLKEAIMTRLTILIAMILTTLASAMLLSSAPEAPASPLLAPSTGKGASPTTRTQDSQQPTRPRRTTPRKQRQEQEQALTDPEPQTDASGPTPQTRKSPKLLMLWLVAQSNEKLDQLASTSELDRYIDFCVQGLTAPGNGGQITPRENGPLSQLNRRLDRWQGAVR
ncbi:hypothetical protein JYT84_00260 [bacterium AH-315-M10]|nr:hypothetical protein [bacterium AH-315-M10]